MDEATLQQEESQVMITRADLMMLNQEASKSERKKVVQMAALIKMMMLVGLLCFF